MSPVVMDLSEVNAEAEALEPCASCESDFVVVVENGEWNVCLMHMPGCLSLVPPPQLVDDSAVFPIEEVAAQLGVEKSVLRQHCYDHNFLMSHPARRDEPYTQGVTAGFFVVKPRLIHKRTGPVVRDTTCVTTAGVEFLRRSLQQSGVIGRSAHLSLVRAGGVA